MTRAFVFPGQASQYVGMARDLYEQYQEVRELYEQANEIMQLDLAEISFNGPEEKLKQTRITQPAIYVHSVAMFDLLKAGNVLPDAVAGHSLGEYSALVAAGAFSFQEGLRLVKIRGELMQRAGEIRPGTMAAIIGLDFEQIEEICDAVSGTGVVCPANYNSPGQVAVSGEIAAVQTVMEKAKEAGAKRAIELVVSGAFHSPLMEHAQEGLRQALTEAKIRDLSMPVYTNVMATPTTSISASNCSNFLIFSRVSAMSSTMITRIFPSLDASVIQFSKTNRLRLRRPLRNVILQNRGSQDFDARFKAVRQFDRDRDAVNI